MAKRKRRVKSPFSEAERKAMRPMPFMLPIDYAEAKIIVGMESPAPGPFSRMTMPLLTSPINSIVDPRYERIIAVAPTQSGKSQGLNQIPLAYFLEYQRRHTGFAIPNKVLAKRVYTTKLRPMFSECPGLEALMPKDGKGSRGGFPTEQILNNGAQWLFMGGGSDSDMSQATIQNLIVDETDKADKVGMAGKEASPIEQMIERTSAHQLDRKLIFTCTVTNEDGFIHNAYQAGTRGKPYYRCPYCGEWFFFSWSLEKNELCWDDDSSEITCENTAYYNCPHCAVALRENDRLKMLTKPLWVHEGERIEECKKSDLPPRPNSKTTWQDIMDKDPLAPFIEFAECDDKKNFIVTGERRQVNGVSWWWNRLSSPFTTMGKLAALAREARSEEKKKQGLSIYDMALAWSGNISSGMKVTAKDIMSHSDYADYRLGSIPFVADKRTVLTVGVDIHKAWFAYVVNAWRVDPKGYLLDSWLIDTARTFTEGGQVGYIYPDKNAAQNIYSALSEALRPMVLRGWEDATGNILQPKKICIDAGYQDNKKRIEDHEKQVYHFCRRFGEGTWVAVKGGGAIEGYLPYTNNLKGSVENKVWYTMLDVDILKSEVREQEGIKPGGNGVRYIPRDTPNYYGRSMAAERRVTREKRGSLESKWERIDLENHIFDAQVYSWSAARMLGVKPPMPASMNEKEE